MAIPLHGGGTGFEVCTWLGDLGGAAGRLAIHRVAEPSRRAKTLFPKQGSSYGSLVNLEGDAAAFLVAKDKDDKSTGLASLNFPPEMKLSDLLSNYLLNADSSNLFEQRASGFLLGLGFKFDDSGAIQNEELVKGLLVNKVFEFAEQYTVFWYDSRNQLTADRMINASAHFLSASQEIIEILVALLKFSKEHPEVPLTPVNIDPDPLPAGSPLQKWVHAKTVEESAAETTNEAQKIVSEWIKRFNDIFK